MRAKIFLADSAEVREGLLFILGGGWSDVGPPSQVFAIAGTIDVEWDETNAPHSVEFTIEEDDGNPLMVPTPTGNQPFKLATQFEVGRPAGSPRGRSFIVPVAIPILPIPWTPGRNYVLIVRIDTQEADRLKFSVRPAPPEPQRT